MESGVVLQIVLILVGLVLLWAVVSSLAKRKMTEPFCLTWGGIAIIIMLAGFLLSPSEWNRYISGTAMILIILIVFCIIYGAYFMSSKVSELMRRNLELSMQVSLLNYEKEEIRKQLEEIAQKIRQESDKL